MQLETPEENRSRKRSLTIAYLVMFLNALCCSIVSSSIWPYLRKVDPSVTKSAYSYAEAGFPVGLSLGSFVFGLWVNKIGTVRVPVLVADVSVICSALIYALLYLFDGSTAYYCMIILRVLMGVGAGNATLMRTYIMGASTLEEKSGAAGFSTVCQMFGYSIAPGIQTILTVVFGETSIRLGWLVLDEYTSAGWIIALFGVVIFILFLPCFFKESSIAEKNFTTMQNKISPDERTIKNKPDYLGAFTCVAIFGFLGNITSLSASLGTIIVSEEYALSASKSLFYSTLLGSISGIVGGTSMLLFVKFVLGKFGERKLLLSSVMIPITIALLLDIPMGSNTMPIHSCSTGNLEKIINQNYSVGHDLKHPLSIVLNTQTIFKSNPSAYNFELNKSFSSNGSADNCLGCPVLEQPWCSHTPQLMPAQIITLYLLSMICFTIGTSLVMSIFVKVLGPSPLGVWMSLPSIASCFIAFVGPLWMISAYQHLGITYLYIILSSVFVLGSFLIISTYKNLSPMTFSDVGL